MITVTRTAPDRLSCVEWRFSASTNFGENTVTLFLDFYGRSTRPTTRHKFKFEPKDRWCRSDERSSIKRADVPLPENVKADAIASVKIEVKSL